MLADRIDGLDYLSPFILDMVAEKLLDIFNLS